MRRVKDFKVGQLAYVVSRRRGGFIITPTTVTKVGRLYVHTHTGYDYESVHGGENYLIEHIQMSILFLTEQDAMDYLEKIQLGRWLALHSRIGWSKYSLDQLRKVKEILSDEK